MEELFAYVKPAMAVVPVSKSGAAIAATAVDGNGYNRCAFLFLTGAMGEGAGVSCSVTESATSGGVYTPKATTAALTDFGTTGASKVYILDVPINSDKPHLKLYGTCGTAAVLHGAVALLYGRNGVAADPNIATFAGEYVRT